MKSHHFLNTLKGIFFSFILLSFVMGCSKKTEEEEKPKAPVADFSFTPVSPKANQAVTFTNTSTNAVSFEWSATGTSFSSTEKNPTFTFTTAGDFDVKLVAKNAAGETASKTTKISVAPADTNAPLPIAAFNFSPASPKTGEEVTFTNTSTNAVSYQWSATGTSFSSTETNPKFTFDAVGDFDVKLVAKNAAGQTNEAIKRVTVTASGGGGNTNPCNLPECYPLKITTATSGITTTETFTYTTVNGKKMISSISSSTPVGNVVTSIQYDAQGRRIKDETKFGATLQNYIEYEYSNNDRTVRGNSYAATGALTGYTISEYDVNMRLTRTETYTSAGTLTAYTVFSNFLNSEGSFPQLVQTYNASNTITQTDVFTYQNCQLLKTESTDGSGTSIGGVNNTIDARGLLRTSVATIIAGGTTTVATSQYVYDCD